MKVWEARLNHLSNILVGGTGIVYGVMRYFMEPAQPWDVVNHPWQPHLQHAHVVAAPLMVFALGIIWRTHVLQKLRSGKPYRWTSGIFLIASSGPMVVSGYLLQTAVSAWWRQAWAWVHIVTSVVWMVGYLIHLVSSKGEREGVAGKPAQSSRSSRRVTNDRKSSDRVLVNR